MCEVTRSPRVILRSMFFFLSKLNFSQLMFNSRIFCVCLVCDSITVEVRGPYTELMSESPLSSVLCSLMTSQFNWLLGPHVDSSWLAERN